MGVRFRKSVKVAPGVKVNFSNKSAGVSVGTNGARVSVNSSGRKTTTVGIPGTGLSYVKTSGNGGGGNVKRQYQTNSGPSAGADFVQPQAKSMYWGSMGISITLAILAATLLIIALIEPICLIFTVLFGLGARSCWKKAKIEKENAKLQEALYGAIQRELKELETLEAEANSAASLAELVLVYEKMAPVVHTIAQKSERVDLQFAFDANEMMIETFAEKFSAKIDSAYKQEVRSIQKLKTRKSIDGHIEKFRAVPDAHREKFTDTQNDKIDEYIFDLEQIRDMTAPE